MRLVLVRHGESLGNAGLPFEGPEPHLTARGQRQAGCAARRAGLREYHALYASPMSRALETACALAESTGLNPTIRPELCEHREIEEFRGFARSSLEARYPRITLPEECTEEGWWTRGREDEGTLYARARQAMASLLDRHRGTEDRVLLVTHGGFASALLSVSFGLPPCGYLRFWHDNCAFTHLDIFEGMTQCRKLNSTWHIPVDDRT